MLVEYYSEDDIKDISKQNISQEDVEYIENSITEFLEKNQFAHLMIDWSQVSQLNLSEKFLEKFVGKYFSFRSFLSNKKEEILIKYIEKLKSFDNYDFLSVIVKCNYSKDFVMKYILPLLEQRNIQKGRIVEYIKECSKVGLIDQEVIDRIWKIKGIKRVDLMKNFAEYADFSYNFYKKYKHKMPLSLVLRNKNLDREVYNLISALLILR